MSPGAFGWTVIAVALSFASSAGGDTSVVCGWLFLIWTIPFGVIWWFCLYDIVLSWIPASIAQPLGDAVVDALAFLFWFVLFPRLRASFKSRRNQA